MKVLVLGGSGMLGHKLWQTLAPRFDACVTVRRGPEEYSGEKIHEILVSEEEAHRTIERDGYYLIQPILPELSVTPKSADTLDREYSSAENVMGRDEVNEMLHRHNLITGDHLISEEDVFE